MTEAIRELEEIFHQAIALEGEERESFLERVCAGQPALRAQLERMIGADEELDTIDTLATQIPQSIGRWTLVEPVGCGGLGTVYRACCEADGVMLQSAVKILHPELSGLLQERFKQERSILVQLDHPYIARIIDAGAGPCGTSFMAMEFVDGLPLDEYLDRRAPDLKDRLALFNRICEAVGYLHDNRVVHGDLKPSNVLVKHDGTPKLVDFGTARLAGESRGAVSFTRLMITPRYASPEQMAGYGPSSASDVYSLGCVLWEMLGSGVLSRDLAAIRDKCLARPVKDRYESAHRIGEDVMRYLKHLPVRARPASSAYVAGKFLRRHWISCGLGTLAALSMLIGLVVSRHKVLQAREYAEQRQSVVAPLVADKPGQRGPEAQQRDAYASGLEKSIEQMERMQPPPAADLVTAWRRLSYSQAARGETPQSLGSIQRSIWWARRYVQTGNFVDSRSQLVESLIYATILLRRRGHMSAAGEYALETIQILETLPEPVRASIEKTPRIAAVLVTAGRQTAATGDPEKGRALLMRALELGRTMGKTSELRFMLDLVQFERSVKQPERAEAWCAQARSLEIKALRLHQLCRDDTERSRAELAAAVAQEAALLERRLLMDPQGYVERLQLARLLLQLTRMNAGREDPARTNERLQRAQALARDLAKADPENRRVNQLRLNIERVRKRVSSSLPVRRSF